MDYHDIQHLEVRTKTKCSEAMMKWQASILEVVEVNYNILEDHIWSYSLSSIVFRSQKAVESRTNGETVEECGTEKQKKKNGDEKYAE